MATVAPDPPLTGHSPAGEVVLAYLREQVAAITRYDPLVRLDEPDAVHQAAAIEQTLPRLTAALTEVS